MARGPNQKAVAANEKKAANQASKDAEKMRQTEIREAMEWKKGSNERAASRAEESAAKADEAARKKREKAALLAMEEEAMGSGKTVKSKQGPAASKKGGTKKKDDLSLLEDALVGDAEKLNKEKKKMERLKKERELQLAAEREQKQKEAYAKRDPLLANTEAMIGVDALDDRREENTVASVGRAVNVASMQDVQASGIDSALSALTMGGTGIDDRHPEKRMKAAYKAYEEKMLPEMKEQYPGLKRQQYLEKIFALWKKSPENPLNQQQS